MKTFYGLRSGMTPVAVRNINIILVAVLHVSQQFKRMYGNELECDTYQEYLYGFSCSQKVLFWESIDDSLDFCRSNLLVDFSRIAISYCRTLSVYLFFRRSWMLRKIQDSLLFISIHDHVEGCINRPYTYLTPSSIVDKCAPKRSNYLCMYRWYQSAWLEKNPASDI